MATPFETTPIQIQPGWLPIVHPDTVETKEPSMEDMINEIATGGEGGFRARHIELAAAATSGHPLPKSLTKWNTTEQWFLDSVTRQLHCIMKELKSLETEIRRYRNADSDCPIQ